MSEREESAFPHEGYKYNPTEQHFGSGDLMRGWPYIPPSLGITKRELFAAMAMQGLCANSEWMRVITKNIDATEKRSFVAAVACEYADALIAKLKRKEGGERGDAGK